MSNEKEIQELQARKAAAFDRLEQFANGIGYGGRSLEWSGKPGSLLEAIEESDRRLVGLREEINQ